MGYEIEIVSNVLIDRDTTNNTIINNGSIIDNLVYIAHNMKIGRNYLIIVNSLIAGSYILEDNVHITMLAAIREEIKIGRNSIVGIGFIVTINIPRNVTVFGIPTKISKKMR